MSNEQNKSSLVVSSPKHYLGNRDMPMSPAKKYPPSNGNDQYTSLLVHSDNPNGSTTFVDSSQYNHTITPINGIAHNTTVAKFGQSSIYWDGVTGHKLEIADHDSLDFYTEDFTIDFWVYLLRTNTYDDLVVKANPGDTSDRAFWLYNQYGQITFVWDWVNGPKELKSPNVSQTNVWKHICVSRNGSNLYLFEDGNLTNSTTISESLSSTSVLTLGAGMGYGLYGYMDEIRISKGIARWTENFTPPTEPYN